MFGLNCDKSIILSTGLKADPCVYKGTHSNSPVGWF